MCWEFAGLLQKQRVLHKRERERERFVVRRTVIVVEMELCERKK